MATMGWAIFSTLVAVELPILTLPGSPESSWRASLRPKFWRMLWLSITEVLGLAAQIVSAHVSHNAVPSDELPGLIRQVFTALATVKQATAAPPKAEPAVNVRRSVIADHMFAWIAGSISRC